MIKIKLWSFRMKMHVLQQSEWLWGYCHGAKGRTRSRREEGHNESEHGVFLRHAEPGGEGEDWRSPAIGSEMKGLPSESSRVSQCLFERETVSKEALCQPLKKDGQQDTGKELEWEKQKGRKAETNTRRKEVNIADFFTVPFLLAAWIEKEGKEKEPAGGEG